MDFYDPDFYDFDEDGNPEYHGHGPAKEEPDCFTCNDSMVVPVRFFRRLRRFHTRPCPSCNPTRLDRLRSAVWWRWWRLRNRLGRREAFTDEAPF